MPDATDDRVIAAAEKAEAHDFIEGLRDERGRTGYEAFVGERGVKLSGGQRQRVAIARVFLKDAPILMLDEATSALDSDIEAAIQENLSKLMEGKTVIAIAHRLSTIAALDRLVVLDGGASSSKARMTSCSRAAGSMRGCGDASPAASCPRKRGRDAAGGVDVDCGPALEILAGTPQESAADAAWTRNRWPRKAAASRPRRPLVEETLQRCAT